MNKRENANLQPCFILQRRKYRESSLLLTVFTHQHGKLTLLAKGALSSKFHQTQILQPFLPLNLSFSGDSDLKVMTGAEPSGLQLKLQGILLYCGYYLCELIDLLLPSSDPHPALFLNFSYRLQQLSDGQPPDEVLRLFETELLEEIGYGLQLEHDMAQMKPIEPNRYYEYQPLVGAVECNTVTPLRGATLIALKQKQITDITVKKEAKQLLKVVIDHHLGGKVLQSRTALTKLLKKQRNSVVKSS